MIALSPHLINAVTMLVLIKVFAKLFSKKRFSLELSKM